MVDPDKVSAELSTLRSAHWSLQSHVARLQWLVQWGLLVAVLLVPLARVTDDGDSDTTTFSVTAAIGFLLTVRPGDLGGEDAHPYAVPGGRAVTVVGLFLILVGCLATAVTSAIMREPEPGRRVVVAQQIAAAVLLVGGFVTWVGLVWLPDHDDDAVGPAWGLLVVFAAGVWASHAAWSSRVERVL
ncbi:MAG: hypothetical protein ABWX96_09770 [Propionibacteriaceae bacterium]